jgi:hypothetical protein
VRPRGRLAMGVGVDNSRARALYERAPEYVATGRFSDRRLHGCRRRHAHRDRNRRAARQRAPLMLDAMHQRRLVTPSEKVTYLRPRAFARAIINGASGERRRRPVPARDDVRVVASRAVEMTRRGVSLWGWGVTRRAPRRPSRFGHGCLNASGASGQGGMLTVNSLTSARTPSANSVHSPAGTSSPSSAVNRGCSIPSGPGWRSPRPSPPSPR